MKYLLGFVMVFAFSGCSFFKTAACDAQKAISPVLSGVVSSQLACAHPEVVQSLIDAQLAKTQLCTVSVVAKGVAKNAVGADLLCPIAIDAVMIGVIAQIPPDAGCTGGPAADVIKTKLIAACEQIPL